MTCTIDNCYRPIFCKHMCTAHYKRSRRGAPLEVPIRGGWQYEDLIDLLAHGTSHVEAATRVGVTVTAAARWFYRHGHLEHARAFQRIANREKAHT